VTGFRENEVRFLYWEDCDARTVRSRSGLNPSMTSPVNRFSATFSSVHPLSQFDCVVSFGLFNPEYGFKKYLLYSRQAAGVVAVR